MRTLDVELGPTTSIERRRIEFRIRMCEGEVLESDPSLLVAAVSDNELDYLVDTLLDTPGVRRVSTRPDRS